MEFGCRHFHLDRQKATKPAAAAAETGGIELAHWGYHTLRLYQGTDKAAVRFNLLWKSSDDDDQTASQTCSMLQRREGSHGDQFVLEIAIH